MEPPTLTTKPLLTLSLFTKYMCSVMFDCLKQAAVYPLTMLLVYPAIVCYVALKTMGLFPSFIHETEVRSNDAYDMLLLIEQGWPEEFTQSGFKPAKLLQKNVSDDGLRLSAFASTLELQPVPYDLNRYLH
jgi:hypothetical protein